MVRVVPWLACAAFILPATTGCTKTCVDDGLHANQNGAACQSTPTQTTTFTGSTTATTTDSDDDTTTTTTTTTTTSTTDTTTGTTTPLLSTTDTSATTLADTDTDTDTDGDPCMDLMQNFGESDIDCGGPCPLKCVPPQMCTDDSDCVTSLCHPMGFCTYPHCQNDVYDPGLEWYVDCGGECGPSCRLGYPCEDTLDCAMGTCEGPDGQKKCALTPECANNNFDVDETSTDCGGPCGATCKSFESCLLDTDCYSNFCSGGCFPSPHCQDAEVSMGEIDLNCGGECGRCPIGSDCVFDSDCDDSSCVSNVCTP
jgi:hypothetical protein